MPVSSPPLAKKFVRIRKGSVQESEEIIIREPESFLEIRVEEGARGEIILKIEGNVREHSLSLVLGDRAELELTTLHAVPRTELRSGAGVARSVSEVRIKQDINIGAHVKLHVCNATIGGHVEHSLVSHIAGSGSQSTIDWVFSGRGEDRLHLSVKNLFDAPEGRGEITVRGVAEGKAHCTCNGMIEITERGSRTDTYLTETMLMLDATARCDAVPALEIKTNDVKASHSATVTKVSEEDLFYLSTRGIPEVEARRMFVEGFLSEILYRFSSESARHSLLQAIGRDLSAF